ncbi:IPT/TIG domain-containing protein [Inediibacterium massiliense]|uniref:IPT/TIG domain-containing protein n=1 Tax=Inediibacterium massiliense TaxID=1658111 RepID=UPI0006B59521|nr:IPT/TIG domain-containing protein [Inediibacterium massiliense]
MRKRIVSFLIIFSMVMGMMPWQDIQSFAYDPDKYYVSHVAITKIYNNGGYDVSETKLTIQGNYLKGIEVSTFTPTGTIVLTNPVVNFETVQEFIVKGDIVGDSIIVGNTSIPIEQKALPTLLSVDKRSVKIGEDPITFTGSNLDKINNEIGHSAYFQNTAGAGGVYTIPNTLFTNTSAVTIPKEQLRGVAGTQNVILKKESTIKDIDFSSDGSRKKDVQITIQNTYLNQFTLVDTISIDGLIMNPNRGRPGDEVLFTATTGLDNFDVFFLEKLNDLYTNENKGTDTRFDPSIDGKQVLTTHVPANLKQGEYYVVLTNKIPPGADPNQSIYKMLIIGQSPNFEKFTVIDAEQKIKILSVEPNKGPDSGSKVELSGVFFGTLNTPQFQPDDKAYKEVNMSKNPDGTTDETNMEIKYSTGSYNGQKVKSAKRTVRVIIGGICKFTKKPDGSDYDYNFTDNIDRMSVITPSITDAETNPIKDVIVETVTTFEFEDTSKNAVVIKDRAELKNGYTYILSKTKPQITSITPEKIQVLQVSEVPLEYKISEEYDRMIAIYGENFLIHKYKDSSGKEIIRYPIIEFGNGIRLNKNDTGDKSNPELYLKVFDKQGKELDGSEGNEIGSKILVNIPKDTNMETVGKVAVKVINPVRNSIEEGLYVNKPDAVEFVLPSQNKKPVIESVVPNVVTIGGGETVTITGSNFQEGVKVIIDGKEVEGITLQGDGKKITFKAPPGREGETQLQVLNPEGGIAIHPFVYVKTYTNPKLIQFNPKSGKTGTLVVVEGENFLKPDPTATKEDAYKLIGTRILLEGKDINEYNIDENTKKITLLPYKAPNEIDENKVGKILRIVNNQLKLEDYYQSIILENKSSLGKYYTIDKNLQNKTILSNGSDQRYSIYLSGNEIIADKDGGASYVVTIEEDGSNDVLKLTSKTGSDTLELKLMTPFKVNENKMIVGNRVQVININKLYFTVPVLPGDGYYDVTVENPDTKKDSKVDQEGFYYYTQPTSRPNIEKIDPKEGSVDGGYRIKITGKRVEGRECFIDNGTEKTKVYINGVQVLDKDVIVGVDGTSLEVVVPKLNVDIQKEYGTDRLAVAVVIVNPDGGSASKQDGFTYIVPISHPVIHKIIPVQGKASGGNYVEITGDDFRFYEPYNDNNRNEKWDQEELYRDLNHYSIKTDKPDTGVEGPDDFTGKRVDDLKEKYKEKYKEIVVPVLPKVYFGSTEAEVVEFDNGYLKVIAPEGKAGPTQVYVVNNDSGISNKVSYTYESSNPTITSISPNGGKKQGRDRVEIKGKDFYESNIKVYDKSGNDYIIKDVSQVIVRFGKITNKNIPREVENSGRIDNGRTSVQLDGGLSVQYNGVDDTLKISIMENQQSYSVTLPYKDETVYVPVGLLTYTDTAGEVHSYVNPNKGDEWIKFELSDRRLFIERGYAPKVEYINSGQIVVHTPSYYTVGVVPVTIINPDGGEVATNFEYKNPDSKPKIINITKDGKNPVLEKIDEKQVKLQKVSYKGGNIISILGSDFRENATIQIGDIVIGAKDITYQLPNKLTFTMPLVDEKNVGKLFRVIVSNEDYGNAASDELTPPIYIQVTKGETGPSIESVTPDQGPSSGGTTVVIKGKDFREGLSVYIGEMMVPKENVKLIDYKTIKIITPPHEPGDFQVVVENPDGERSDPTGQYTYLSAPQIVSVVDPKDSTETSVIDTISVEGGEEIKIKGSGFIEGARVVFVPSTEQGSKEDKGEIIYIKGEPYKLLEGTDAAEVKFIDEGTLIVKTPAGKIDTKGIIVINPDMGASDIYENIKYGLPELPTPTGVRAEIVYDQYIKVNWNEVKDAKEYEIYVVVDGHKKEFVGSTELTSFVYEDLEPKTRYKFVVTAIGKFGGSKYSMESNEVKTGSTVGPKDTDGELGEKTKIERQGNLVNIIIGEDDYDQNLDIDLTRGNLAGAKDVVISIPSYVAARADAKDINIIGSDFNIKMNPKSFYSEKVRENKNKKDSGIKFMISQVKNMSNVSSMTSLSKEYELKASVYVERENTPMNYLPSYVQITMDVDRTKADVRRTKNMYLARYNEETRQWLPIANGNEGSYAITGLSQNLGRFSVIGSRR